MWNKLLDSKNTLMGYYHRQNDVLFFFGSRHFKKEHIAEYFPHLKACLLKQVHGPKIVEATPEQVLEADGHWSTTKNLALIIQTADCVPVLATDGKKVVAVHAGWRGLEAGIVKDLNLHIKTPVFVCSGPHIRKESFEVGKDVAEKIAATLSPGDPNPTLPHADPAKNYVDLELVTGTHLRSSFAPSVPFNPLQINTYTDKDFASYRLLKGSPERQLSFVALEARPNV